MTAFGRYVAAWNAGDREGWLAVHHEEVEYVSLASADARVFRGHDGMREVWDESRGNWSRFIFSILAERDELSQVAYSGIETLGGAELKGVLWFRAQSREGQIVRLWSAFDAAALPTG